MSSVLSALNIQTFLIGIIVLLTVYKFRQRWKHKLPPGPFAWPLIGNYEVMKAKFLHEICAKYTKIYGPVFTIKLGPFQMVVLNDINSVTEALVKRKADFANRPFIQSVDVFTEGGRDIAFANYTPTWKLHRKIAGKALSAELDDPDFVRFMKIDRDFTDIIGKGFVEDMFPIMYKICPTKKYRTVKEIFDEMIAMIERKFREHEDTFDCDNIRDLTDSLILTRKEAEQDEEMMSQLTDTHLRQTLVDIFRGGIDTSRVTLYFVIRYMAGLPDIQNKVQEEIDNVVGKDRLPGVNDRESLSYTEATLHEAMRLGTVSAFGLPHFTVCDTHVGGYDVPKDTMVMINHWALHHDPNYWKDVDKFDPTRYLDENGKLGIKPESWLPFSAGRRVCLGESIAKPELHLIFATIMQRFEITMPDETNPELKLGGSGLIPQPAPFEIIVKDRNMT
ncbi:steroid 17-alpha-hydroxylase/17,20 lyase-like isoform X3 [Mytilus galloprovincialis]|uniref:steroid 17-alpha-hydroxylase/17,20 lyase-like isoform X3 n=1 Tax=Mytilus galloprovincialis TaxID=29158 RepID=UPI003F7BBBE7